MTTGSPRRLYCNLPRLTESLAADICKRNAPWHL